MPAKNRTRQILGAPVQKVIIAADDREVHRWVTNAAVYLSACGFLDLANQLLTRLWSFKLEHSPDVWLADRAMMVLWHEAGQRPAAVPFPLQEIDSIESAHRQYMTGNRWSETFLNNDQLTTPEALAIKLLAKAMIESYRPPTPARDSKAIADFTAFAESGFCVGYNAFSALTNLVEICARNGRLDDAKRWLLRWHDAYVQYWPNFSFDCLAAYRHAAPLLLERMLARPCGLDAKSSAAYVEGLLQALDRRMATGRALARADLGCRQLLEEISRLALVRGVISFPASIKKSKWLGRKPASEPAIRQAEARLKARFPADYEEFLRTSNGFEPVNSTGIRVFPVEEVKWLIDAEPDLVEAWNLPEIQNVHRSLKESLLIGDFNREQQLLLTPIGKRRKMAWECWFFASWVPGEVRYPSFRAYMENELLELEKED
ncbi:MAG TPA: SMI1/KNR4 family protein [Gemmataceae bacterium]|nr:SMI1/KNR4 family protein [Gemmataceae bacterium]